MNDDQHNWVRLRGPMSRSGRSRRISIDVESIEHAPFATAAINPAEKNTLRDDYETVEAWDGEHPVL